MKDVTKVILGSQAMLCKSALVSRVGTTIIATMPKRI
jgi:translation initiation factor 2B subunit (eIF-2B alpha/beta/delta family)